MQFSNLKLSFHFIPLLCRSIPFHYSVKLHLPKFVHFLNFGLLTNPTEVQQKFCSANCKRAQKCVSLRRVNVA